MTKQPQFEATRTWPDSTWHTDMPFDPAAIAAGEQRGEIEQCGPWRQLVKYQALAMEQVDGSEDKEHYNSSPFRTEAVLHGIRSLLNPRQEGYQLEGFVSVQGKRRRAFTSSALFEVNGKLIDVAILYVCKGERG